MTYFNIFGTKSSKLHISVLLSIWLHISPILGAQHPHVAGGQGKARRLIKRRLSGDSQEGGDTQGFVTF